MINYFNKKRGSVAINKMVIVILVLLVVVAVLMFIFKADILNYLKSLPGYSVPEEDEEIDLGEIDPEVARSLCPIRVGGIDKDGKIYFCNNFEIGCKTRISSKLLWAGNAQSADIEIDKFFDKTIGRFENDVITIDKNKLEGESNLPESKFLNNLDGSYYLEGNFLCRKAEV